MNDLNFSVKTAILEPTDSITEINANMVEETLIQAIQQPDYCSYLINMQRVELLDNRGLMVLITAFRLAQSLGKQLWVCSLTPSVKIIFDLTQLDRFFTLLESPQAFDRTTNLA